MVMKLKRELYRLKAIKPGETVLIHTNGSPSSMAALDLMVNATSTWRIKLLKKHSKETIDKHVFTNFLQDGVNGILKGMMTGELKTQESISGNEVRPFLIFSGKALATYAILTGLNFTEGETKELSTVFQSASVALCLNFTKAYEKLRQEF
ncbi:MAG: hypothetical protein GOV00_00125 [Candidatus Altiarchaeota archaeon]|nr:hypothetical protein [Candidatus Altiarchaeota archaeon]